MSYYYSTQNIIVHFKTIIGKTYTTRININSTLLTLKQEFKKLDGISPERLSLSCNGKRLDNDDKTLREYGLYDNCILRMALHLRGG